MVQARGPRGHKVTLDGTFQVSHKGSLTNIFHSLPWLVVGNMGIGAIQCVWVPAEPDYLKYFMFTHKFK